MRNKVIHLILSKGGGSTVLDFFLVLGQIPDTNIQITFSEMLLVNLVLLGALFYVYYSRPTERPQLDIRLSRLHGFSYPIGLNSPVEPTRRRVVTLPINTWLGHLYQRLPIARLLS